MSTLSDEFIAKLYELPLSNRWHELITSVEQQFGSSYSVLGLFLTSSAGKQTKRGAVLASQHGYDGFRTDLDEFNVGGISPIARKARSCSSGDTFKVSALSKAGASYAPEFLDMLNKHSFSDSQYALIEMTKDVRLSLNLYEECGSPLRTFPDANDLQATSFHLSQAIALAGRLGGKNNWIGNIFSLAQSSTPFWLIRPEDCTEVASNANAKLPFRELPRHVLRQVRKGQSAHAIFKIGGLKTGFRFSPAPTTDEAGVVLTVERELFLVTPQELPSATAAFLDSYMSLTDQEHRIIERLGRGQTEANIAAGLRITDNTFRYHRKNAYSKLQVSSKTELMLLIAQHL